MSASLGSDNHSGIHPKILESLMKANTSHAHSYGQDEWSQACEKIIKQKFGQKAQPYLVFNGTAANVASLRALVKSYEAIICSEQSHLHLDECGAPEFHLGSKLLVLPSEDGKITPEAISQLLTRLGDQHHVQPGAVSITQPTELGLCYTLEELKELREFTAKHNLRLHVDGARLSNAAHYLGCSLKNLTEDIGIDALSFGGTKNGLLGVDAVIFWGKEFATDFKYHRKQLMQLPSKMRFLSSQFLAYFEDDLYLDIAKHSHLMAKHLESGLRKNPMVEVLFPTQSNAVFARFPKAWIKTLKSEMFFYVWEEKSWACRLMTSFDSKLDDIDRFLTLANSLKENSNE